MPEAKPRLFISHSFKDTEVSKAVRGALDDLYEIFLDADVIRTGDDWRQKIERALIECDVGLVLTSEHSAESQWVPAEAFMLAVRGREIDGVKVVPIFLDGYSPGKLKDPPWNPADLGATNGLPLVSAPGATQDRQLARIVSDLKPWAEEIAQRGAYLLEVEEYLAGKLKGLNSQSRIAKALGIEQKGNLFLDQARWLAGKVLRAHDLMKFNDVILAIKEMDSEELARELVENLSPYCWIDAELARELNVRVLSKQRPKPSVGLVAQKERTPRACVQRASQRVIKAWKLWPVTDDWDHDDVLDYLIEEVMSHLRSRHIVDFGAAEPTKEVRENLEMYIQLHGEVVVLLPHGFAKQDNELLEGLNEAFQHLTFLLATESEKPGLTERFENFHPLPVLEPGAEKRADFILRLLEPAVGLKPAGQSS